MFRHRGPLEFGVVVDLLMMGIIGLFLAPFGIPNALVVSTFIFIFMIGLLNRRPSVSNSHNSDEII